MGVRFHQLAADAKTRVREVSAAEASQEQCVDLMLLMTCLSRGFRKVFDMGSKFSLNLLLLLDGREL